ncbi:hypothetical protein NXY25_04450 [Bacteroides thetaiotaomicron]|nr:hypothetical protein [Bacteroides thetaiotaomicron]
MKNLTWQNPEQLFVAQELINKVKSKCCGIKVEEIREFLPGVVKANIPEKFLEFYFVKMDAVRPVFQITHQKFEKFT